MTGLDSIGDRSSSRFRLTGGRETRFGNRRRSAATAETTGYSLASYRAVDWQPEHPLQSEV